MWVTVLFYKKGRWAVPQNGEAKKLVTNHNLLHCRYHFQMRCALVRKTEFAAPNPIFSLVVRQQFQKLF